MKRLTTDKPTKEMTMTELAHNCMISKDQWAVYRDYDQEIDLQDLIIQLSQDLPGSRYWPMEKEHIDELLCEYLQLPLSDPDGLLGFIYRNLWAMADLRERLKAYEDTGLKPEAIKAIVDGLKVLGTIMLTGKDADDYRAARAEWIMAEKEKPDSGSYEKLWLTIKDHSGEYRTVEGRYSSSWDAFTYANQQSITAGQVIAWKKYHEPAPYWPDEVQT